MAYAEKRGRFWRARWLGPDGTLESKSGFTTEKAALQHGRDQKAAIRSDTYVDPRAGQITLTDWVNEWYPAQDLEPITLVNYKYAIESFILPEFGHRALKEITPEEVGKWEKNIVANGWAPRTARDARTTLTVIYGDAIPRHVKVNPAQRKRGKGRKGRRRIERIEQQTEKIWPTPLEVLLVAERVAVLTGRDEDFVMEITDAYTGMRWSETTGLSPRSLRDDELDLHWKLYELGGRFYKGRPKDGSMRTVDLPPFLAELLAWHVSGTKGRKCTCRKPQDSDVPDEHNKWCMGSRLCSSARGEAITSGHTTANGSSDRPPMAGIQIASTARPDRCSLTSVDSSPEFRSRPGQQRYRGRSSPRRLAAGSCGSSATKASAGARSANATFPVAKMAWSYRTKQTVTTVRGRAWSRGRT